MPRPWTPSFTWFSNFAPWGGFQSQITYRYRPDGMNPDGCIMDIYLLDGLRPINRGQQMLNHSLDYDQKYADAEGLVTGCAV